MSKLVPSIEVRVNGRPVAPSLFGLTPMELIITILGSALLIYFSKYHYVPLTNYYVLNVPSMTEVFGFVTGAVTVWLCAKENIWNWPIGIVNNVFFIVLFFGARLFADMSLQVVYIVLSIGGWYLWLRGGDKKTGIVIQNTSARTWAAMVLVGAVATYGMMKYLASVGDSAPFLDALTTVMSLLAQYGLMKKLIENWFIWIAVDVIYIPLYIYKGLPLTGILYVVFLLMCIVGYVGWRKTRTQAGPVVVVSNSVAISEPLGLEAEGLIFLEGHWVPDAGRVR
jgi:nicotinamide mononucleotide transporter